VTAIAPSSRSQRLLGLTTPAPLKLRWGWITLGALILAGLPTLLVQSAPTYDPWAWIIWGREIIHGDLITTTGPSWKPLPMVLTIPFALFGDHAPDLWLWVSRAVALIGVFAVADLASRLGGRLAAWIAGAAILTNGLYYAYGVQGSSEGALVLVCCLAAAAWLDGRRTAVFWWLVAAALLRPEAWAFVAVIALERLWNDPKRILWIGPTGLAVIAAWLVPEKIGSGAFLRAASRAHDPNPESAAFAKHPSVVVIGSMGDLLLWVPLVGLGIALIVGIYAWRKDGSGDGEPETAALVPRSVLRVAATLVLFAGAWVVIVAAMTEGGYAGNPRYLAAPLALLLPVGVAGLIWLVRLVAQRSPTLGDLLVLVAMVTLLVSAISRLPHRTEEIIYQAENRTELTQLEQNPAVRKAIASCRPISAHPLMVPPIAWTFGLHLEDVTADAERPQRAGTFIIGRNATYRVFLPELPRGVAAHEVGRTDQIRIVQTCAR
jgi:hypothetical protein